MTVALEVGEWSAARSGRTLFPGETRCLFYRRLGGPEGWSGRAENLVPTGIRSRTVQPVAQSLYRLSYRAHISQLVDNKLKIVGRIYLRKTNKKKRTDLQVRWRHFTSLFRKYPSLLFNISQRDVTSKDKLR